MRMVESRGPGKWFSSKDAATFAFPFNSMAAEELEFLIKGHRLHGDQRDKGPNRSGSAPPCMDGSFVAMENIMAQYNSSLNTSLASVSNAIKNCESEEQLHADPAYFAYYCSNVNLNPRLPPPLISRENRHLVRHIGGFGNNWKLTSLDNIGSSSLNISQCLLSTHKEDPEDDRSPRKALDDWSESNSSVQNSFSFSGCHKSLPDRIQEEFPCSLSPVYSQSCSSSHGTLNEPIDHDLHAISLDAPSDNISRLQESGSSSVDDCSDTCSLNTHTVQLISNKNNSATVFSVSDGTENQPLPQKDESGSKGADLESDEFISGAVCLDNTGVESSPRGINVSDLLVAENNRNKQEQQSYERNMQQYHPGPIRGASNQVHGVQAQVISHGMNRSYSGAENVLYGQHNFSSPEVHPAPPSSGFTSPLYVTAASYMTPGDPFYSNLQPSGLFSPQYSVGGYASSSVLFPSYIAGYVPHGAIPMPFNTSSGPRFNVQTPNVSTGESIPLVGDVQHINKFYEQHGLMLQPPFVDPLYTQYFQLPLESAYGSSGQYGQLASRTVIGGQVDNLVSQSESTLAAYMDAQKLQLPANGSPSIPTTVKHGVTGSSYCGSPPGMGFMTQFPTPPLVSPVLPGSPVCGTNHQGRRNELRFSQGSVKNAGSYSSWQGLRGAGNSNAPPKHSILEELKTSNVRKFDLSDNAGRIVEFSVDQHGSRFIQQKIENCSVEEKVSIFKEVLPQALKLTTDVFGNYVIQKFFEHGSPGQRKELVDQLAGQILPLSLQMYGCRVIQKALEVIEPDQKAQLVYELDGHVMRCVCDQNGNHVIQKSIECIPTEEIGFIISAFQGQVAMLSTHPYGCRVIQRVLEHCSDEKSRCIVDEILEAAFVLAQDQYGNYVTQHILERGKPCERRQIISMLTGKLVQMSHHKYASNVVEKCLEHGDAAERELLIDEIIGQSDGNDTLLTMMKDQFANYVIQKILEISNDERKEILLHRISVHLHALNKYAYRKHIVARFEQLCAVKEKE